MSVDTTSNFVCECKMCRTNSVLCHTICQLATNNPASDVSSKSLPFSGPEHAVSGRHVDSESLAECNIAGPSDQMNCLARHDQHLCSRESAEGKAVDLDLRFSNHSKDHFHLPRDIGLNFVYQRKRLRTNSVASPYSQANNNELTDGLSSAISGECLLLAEPECTDISKYVVKATRSPSESSGECKKTGNKCLDLHQDQLNSSRELVENHSCDGSDQSISGTISRDIAFNYVYQRRRHRTNSIVISPIRPTTNIPIDGLDSATSSQCRTLAEQEHADLVLECPMGATRTQCVVPAECNGVSKICINGYHSQDGAASGDARTFEVNGALHNLSTIDDCSSSRSNLDHMSTSLKVGVDDAGECSSSGAVMVEEPETSERNICISILRSQGLLGNIWDTNQRASTGSSSENYCTKSCKICARRDSTKNMLICDNCGRAFHKSCCSPRIKILPVGDWLCSCCLEKKHNLLKDEASNSAHAEGRYSHSAWDAKLGSLGYLFQDNEPYMSNVRIGDKYQADVPGWHGPDNNACDLHGDPLELDTFNVTDMQDQSSLQPLNLCLIGNWVQCRGFNDGVGEGSDSVICGKWRRVPLSEVQTDDWECFCCISWDPGHADCAAPQELETEEVMKQLKYIDILRPRLTAKKRKMESSKRAAKDP